MASATDSGVSATANSTPRTFLTELESTRGNSAATRNTRLTAIHWLFRYASLQAPGAPPGLISRVLAIPAKRTRTDIVSFLTQAEVDALIGAVDATTWHGRCDQTLLRLAAQTPGCAFPSAYRRTAARNAWLLRPSAAGEAIGNPRQCSRPAIWPDVCTAGTQPLK